LRPAPRRLSKASRRPGYQLIYSVSWEQRGQEGLLWPGLRPRPVLDRRSPRHWADLVAARGPWRGSAGRLAQDDAGLRPPGAAAPGAQLTLFETEDGWRYSLRVTNGPQPPRAGWAERL